MSAPYSKADKKYGTPDKQILSYLDVMSVEPVSMTIIWRSLLHFRSSGLIATTIKITPMHCSKWEFWRKHMELPCSQSTDWWTTLADKVLVLLRRATQPHSTCRAWILNPSSAGTGCVNPPSSPPAQRTMELLFKKCIATSCHCKQTLAIKVFYQQIQYSVHKRGDASPHTHWFKTIILHTFRGVKTSLWLLKKIQIWSFSAERNLHLMASSELRLLRNLTEHEKVENYVLCAAKGTSFWS